MDGQLYCRPDEHGPLIPHSLDLDQRCSVVKLPDHVHGPDCGHEVVAHGDHFDFLVRPIPLILTFTLQQDLMSQ